MESTNHAPYALNYFSILGPSQRILAYVSKKLHSSAEMLTNTGKAIAIHAIKGIASSSVIETTTLPLVYYRTRQQITAVATLQDPSMNGSEETKGPDFTWILSFNLPNVLGPSSPKKKSVQTYKDIPPDTMRALLRLAHSNFSLLHGQSFKLTPVASNTEKVTVELDPLIQAYASLFIERMQSEMNFDTLTLFFSGEPLLLPVTHTSPLSIPLPKSETHPIPWILFRIRPTFALEHYSDHPWHLQDLHALVQFVYFHRTSPVVVYLPSSPETACPLFLDPRDQDYLLLRLHSRDGALDLPPVHRISSKHVNTFMVIPPTKARWPLDLKEAKSIVQLTHQLERCNATRGAILTSNKHWVAVDRVTGRGSVITSATQSVSLSSVMEALLQQDMDDL
ncbi:hypothetical protein HMI54_013783 [Coelomomyces lativittatus]|nr:hypothetical protein HMI56_003333 [Coelomomyces lativittatus]KAJ1514658.1 hypothetical protein HMI54_013783 [Coelomomyces lativittatus]KAJ1516020.1 hypothetical protein HMI55_003130 [Coelomomyces lativittatus]